MNICLIRPSRLMVKGAMAYAPTPPVGMAYIASVLRKAGHTVTIIDAIGQKPNQTNSFELGVNSTIIPKGHEIVTLGLSPAEVFERIPAKTDIVGLSCMFTNNWLADRHLIQYIGKHLPTAIIIAGGESISALPELWLKQAPALKVCVIGEGEDTVVNLVNAIYNQTPLDSVSGIAFSKDQEVVRTPTRSRLKNLDDIPLPAWDLFDKLEYEPQKANQSEVRYTLALIATRGCPYTCTFCTSPDMWGTRYYMRSPIEVIEEIEYLIKRFGITNFDFYDLTAIIKKDWIIAFATLIIDRKLQITWRIPAGTRSEAIDKEVANYLYRSGCWSITYAPESGSARFLKVIKKKVVLSRMLKSIKDTHSENMIISINMILALPDETHLDVWKTLWFLVQCSLAGANEMNLAIFRPYPGSALFDRMVKEGKITLENDNYFVESLFIIDDMMWDSVYFNDQINKFWYRFYDSFALTVFYSSNFIFRPSRFIKAMRNIINNQPESRFEEKFRKFLLNLFVTQ